MHMGGKLDQILDLLEQIEKGIRSLNNVEKKLDKLEGHLVFANILADAFECVICRSVATRHMSSSGYMKVVLAYFAHLKV